MVTPANHRQVKEIFYIQFMELIQSDEEHKDMSHEQKDISAKYFARMEAIREQKHYKAWLKGKRNYKYKGRAYKVLTEPMKDAKYLTDNMNLEEVIEQEFKDAV